MGMLIKISAVIVALFVGFLLMISAWGNSIRYQEFQSTFTQTSEALKVTPWEQAYLVENDPTWILWVDVYLADNNLLLAKPWMERNKDNSQLEKIATPSRPLVAELLKKYPERRFILNITDNVMDIEPFVSQLIQESGAEKRIAIQSPYNVVMDVIKKKWPLLLYGSTLPDMTRLLTHESLWILSAAPFKGDILISELRSGKVELVSLAIVKELKRRFKKILVGPLKNKQEIDTALSLGSDGLFVEDPLLLQ
jgi:hypothetical protein